MLERAVLASLEMALRIRPEELDTLLTVARRRLAEGYEGSAFAPDITQKSERDFIAAEVERLMRGLQAEMGFAAGKSVPENG